jgi:hypothetical protein
MTECLNVITRRKTPMSLEEYEEPASEDDYVDLGEWQLDELFGI